MIWSGMENEKRLLSNYFVMEELNAKIQQLTVVDDDNAITSGCSSSSSSNKVDLSKYPFLMESIITRNY